MKKYIVLALVSLCFWACSEDEIKPYNDGNYLYFSQLVDSKEDHIAVSFNNYPTSEEFTVEVGLGLVGKLLPKDMPYKVIVVTVDEEGRVKNADPKNYRLPAEPTFKAGQVKDVLEVTLVKTPDLKEDVTLCLKLVPNDYFLGAMQQYEQIRIVFNNVISQPLWWDKNVTKLFLGTYSRKKYEDFVRFSGIADFGKLSTGEKRQAALGFKYYVAENNIMDKDDSTGEEYPMIIPVD